MELLWALAADAPSVIVEANFRPPDRYQREKLSALAGRPVEVYCQCDHELAARRYNQRARTCHPIHVVTRLTPDMLAGYDRPVCIGELVTVNTALPIDAAAVAAAVRAHLPPPGVARAGRWHGAALRHYASAESCGTGERSSRRMASCGS